MMESAQFQEHIRHDTTVIQKDHFRTISCLSLWGGRSQLSDCGSPYTLFSISRRDPHST